MRHLMITALEALVFMLGLIIPRTDKVWIIGGSHGLRYADNSMHFFRYCRRATSKRVVWLTRSANVLDEVRSEGHEAYYVYSIRGLWLGLRAGWHVFDVGPTDTGPASRGARRLNLWHGIPLKDISSIKRSRKNYSRLKQLLRLIVISESREYLAHPNLKHISHMLDAFNVPNKNIFLANLPRNEVLLNQDAVLAGTKLRDRKWREEILELRRQGRTIIGYFPTWRNSGEDKFLGITDLSEIGELNKLLAHNKCTLVSKWHSCSYSEYKHYGQSQTAGRIDSALRLQNNILLLDFPTDLNPVLELCDALVTDYSSVLFDFLLTGRPQFFVPYDLGRYRDASGLLFDYEPFVPGPIVQHIPDLINLVVATRNAVVPDSYASKRAEMRKTFFEEERGSNRIIELMESAP